jgi:NTE family protein
LLPLLRGDLESGPIAFTTTQAYAQLRLDTLDSVAFPTRGTLLQATWRSGSLSEGRPGLGGGSARAYRHQVGALGRSRERRSLARLQRGGTFGLGGFLRLSGTPISSLYGQTEHARVAS